MAVWMRMNRISKCLGYGDDAGTRPTVTDGFSHHLLDGLTSEPSQVPIPPGLGE
jgi:hypothetical protein